MVSLPVLADLGAIPASVIGPSARAVRAIYFDKSEQANWSLDWHQDRVICVREKVDVQGYGPWTIKSGLLHVTPPFEVLERMVTIRIHLDDVGQDNAPLLIAPGSHRLGRIAEANVTDAVERCGTAVCFAQAGDVWLYASPIVHASQASARPSRRRVLQIDYAALDLPGGLEWREVQFR